MEYREYRAKIEAERGIFRDNEGKIIRSKEWIIKRIQHLEFKIGEFEKRITNAKQEIKDRKEQLNELI